MREILFRGKRVDNGEWVYGDLITKPIHHECVILGNGCINYAVDPSTVGQYTGINDKNGNKIFEGDRVKADWNDSRYKPVKGVVEWEQHSAQWLFGAGLASEAHWSHEVIGSIHETQKA